MSNNLDLFDIAWLNKTPLESIIKNSNLGVSVKELKDILNHSYREDSDIKKKFKSKDKKVRFQFDVKGIQLEATFEPNKNIKKREGQNWALISIYSAKKKKDLLYEFAEFFDFDPKFRLGTEKLDKLADLALEEDWGKDNNALVKYIIYTFHYLKLNEEDKIMETNNKELAVFNTGLVDRSFWKDIYALFEKNKSKSFPEYRFVDFCIIGSSSGKKISENFSDFPEKANYFTRENASDILIFDHKKELDPNLDHIVFDGLKRGRFPKEIIEKFNIKKEEFINESTPSENIVNLIKHIEKSIEHAQKRVGQNYKIALPMYYPKRNEMSFLLPIVLSEDLNAKADLALVVSLAKNSGRYIGQTVLTLPMAYSNSRLICKPSNEWLEINSDSEIDDDLEIDD